MLFFIALSPVLRPFEQVGFEKSLFRTNKGEPVEFGAKQCMCSSRDTCPLSTESA